MIRLLSMFVLALALLTSAPAKASPQDDANAWLKTLGDAFNKGDAKAIAAMFTDDGDVISPTGVVGKGHAAAEKVIAADIAGILKGATSKFSSESVRELAPNVWLVDATHEAQNMTGPDGKTMTGKLHVVFVLTKKDKKLMCSAARPYMYLPPPPVAATPKTPPKK